MVNGIYTLRHKRIVVASAISILQLKAGANIGFDILRVVIGQSLSASSAQAEIALVRKTVAATVTAAVSGTNLYKHNPNDPISQLVLSVAGTGLTASAEGTDGDEVWGDTFNVLNGLLYKPSEKEIIYVPPSGIIALKFPVAPSSQTWTASITIREN